jgi:hypothetical protein
MWFIINYSDVIYHSTAFFELSLKMWFIINYSDVIYHSTARFELSLKMWFIDILCFLEVEISELIPYVSWKWRLVNLYLSFVNLAWNNLTQLSSDNTQMWVLFARDVHTEYIIFSASH